MRNLPQFDGHGLAPTSRVKFQAQIIILLETGSVVTREKSSLSLWKLRRQLEVSKERERELTATTTTMMMAMTIQLPLTRQVNEWSNEWMNE